MYTLESAKGWLDAVDVAPIWSALVYILENLAACWFSACLQILVLVWPVQIDTGAASAAIAASTRVLSCRWCSGCGEMCLDSGTAHGRHPGGKPPGSLSGTIRPA